MGWLCNCAHPWGILKIKWKLRGQFMHPIVRQFPWFCFKFIGITAAARTVYVNQI